MRIVKLKDADVIKNPVGLQLPTCRLVPYPLPGILSSKPKPATGLLLLRKAALTFHGGDVSYLGEYNEVSNTDGLSS